MDAHPYGLIPIALRYRSAHNLWMEKNNLERAIVALTAEAERRSVPSDQAARAARYHVEQFATLLNACALTGADLPPDSLPEYHPSLTSQAN